MADTNNGTEPKRARRTRESVERETFTTTEQRREALARIDAIERDAREALAKLGAYLEGATASTVAALAKLDETNARLAKLEELATVQARALAHMQRATAMHLELAAAKFQAEQGGRDDG